MKITLYILIILLIFCSCESKKEILAQKDGHSNSINNCDTLISFTIELLKNDKYEIDYEGIKLPEMIHFTHSKYSDSGEKSTIQIPFYDSTIQKKSTFTRFDDLDIDTIFTANDLKNYSSKSLSRNCINWKVINSDTIKNWDLKWKEKNKKNGALNMPFEWFRFFEISTPVLSKSGEYIYIEINELCYGLCSNGKSYLFRNIEGKWTCIGRQLRWIS